MPKDKDYENYMVAMKNNAMRAKMPYTALEQKVAALIISIINPADNRLKKYAFKTAEIIRLLKLGDKNYQLLYDVTEGLLKNPITIKKPDGGLYQSNIIADADYSEDRSTVTFTIAETMQKYLIQILQGEYTQFYLSNILGLRSKYSIAMYRFCKSFEFQKIIKKSIEEIKFCLGIENYEYRNFTDFRINVLEKSQKELEEKTDIRFSYKPETRGKKVIALFFTINFNPQVEQKLETAKKLAYLAEIELDERKKQVHELALKSMAEAKEARGKGEDEDNLFEKEPGEGKGE